MVIEFAKFNPVFEDIRRRLEHDAEPADLEQMNDDFWHIIATNRNVCAFAVKFDEYRGDYVSGPYEQAAFFITAKLFHLA